MDVVRVYTLGDFATQLTSVILSLNMLAFYVFEKIAFVIGLIVTVST